MTVEAIPTRLNLKKDEKLEIEWQDGHTCVYPISYLRSKCPCATCKTVRDEQKQAKSLLTVLPGNYAKPLAVVNAELVGNYAMKIAWSDEHDTGIYSFQYLREICPEKR